MLGISDRMWAKIFGGFAVLDGVMAGIDLHRGKWPYALVMLAFGAYAVHCSLLAQESATEDER